MLNYIFGLILFSRDGGQIELSLERQRTVCLKKPVYLTFSFFSMFKYILEGKKKTLTVPNTFKARIKVH